MATSILVRDPELLSKDSGIAFKGLEVSLVEGYYLRDVSGISEEFKGYF